LFRTRGTSTSSREHFIQRCLRDPVPLVALAYLIDCTFLLLAVAFVPLPHPLEIPLLLPTTLFLGGMADVHDDIDCQNVLGLSVSARRFNKAF
jgi:hypothetical protein